MLSIYKLAGVFQGNFQEKMFTERIIGLMRSDYSILECDFSCSSQFEPWAPSLSSSSSAQATSI